MSKTEAPEQDSSALGPQRTNSSSDEETQMGIAYCPLRQRAYKDTISNIKKKQCIKVPITSRRGQADIRVPISDTKVDLYLATVNLNKLGMGSKLWSKSSKVNCIYVLGQVPNANGSLGCGEFSVPSSPEL